MTNETVRETFLGAAEAWVCDDYSLDIRYLAERTAGKGQIWQASIALNPLAAKMGLDFRIDSSRFVVGQVQRFPMKKAKLLTLLCEAASGNLELREERLALPNERPHDYFSEMAFRDRWFSELHLQVSGSQAPVPSATDLTQLDNTLRSAVPPFDGLHDVCAWLGLVAPGTTSGPATISIRVGPPCDLIFDRCSLSNDQLRLTLHAHPRFDVARVGLAIRAVPGIALTARRQLASEIKWSRVRDGRREGVAQLHIEQADSVLAMLMVGTSTVRRQWFLDPTKARNNRLLAVQHFDKDLRMLKQAVLESPDSVKFEQGVAALLFLLGFTPAIQLEADAPDIVVTTPGGKLAIVECTTRIADFGSKVGKLVDRRGALSKSLAASGHPALVAAVLVCRLPRDQIAAQANEPRAHNTILLTGEDLLSAFDRLRFPNDPDKMLDETQARLSATTI